MALDRPDIQGITIHGTVSEAGLALREEIGLPREAYSLLAQANLFRMRGCWEEAVTNCMAALRLAPDSPSAQSLLGDIYENQGRIDDAVQWYRMALDANPRSPADRLKLDRLLERQEVPGQQSAEAGPPSEAPKTLPRPVPMFTRLRRMARNPEAALRYGALTAALLVVFTVAFAFGAVHHRAALAALGLGTPQEVQIKPVVVPASSSLAADAPAAVPHDASEQAVLASLRHAGDLSASGLTVIDVQSDPRSAHLSVTMGLSSANSLTRAAVLRGALQTIQDAAPLSPTSTLFTVRCLALPAGADDTGSDSLIFVGDVTRASLPDATAVTEDGQIQALFASSWWSSQLPS